jgi:hypothetical protein
MSRNDTAQLAPVQLAPVDPTLMYPRLRHSAFSGKTEDGPLVMIVGKEYFEITEEFGTRQQFFTIRRYLDGRHSLPEIAEITGIDEESVRQVATAFYELGLLHHADPADLIDSQAFVEQIEASCEMWGRQVGLHRIFGMLEEGMLRKEVFLGLMLETYHYVNSAARHIATAISHCDNEGLIPLLSEYFVEEHDHGELILGALERMGMPREHAKDANPLIGTWSLINNLCHIARQDTLAYLACTTLFEARADDFEEGAESLQKAAGLVGYDPKDTEPLISHMRIDIAAGHVGLLRQAMPIIGNVPARTAHRSVDNLHNLKHSYDQFHDSILDYYGNIGNHIPRLHVDYFSL